MWVPNATAGIAAHAPLCGTRAQFGLCPLCRVRADRVLRECGKGTFGKVLLCEDLRASGTRVAVKVVRKIRKYTAAAYIEADVLDAITRRDPAGTSLCVRYYRSFLHRGHMCLVFEPLGVSLYDYLTANEYQPLPLYCVQAFSDQLVRAISFLHEMKLVHTDLKLENVLLCDTDPLETTDKPTRTRLPTRLLAPRTLDIRGAYGVWRCTLCERTNANQFDVALDQRHFRVCDVNTLR